MDPKALSLKKTAILATDLAGITLPATGKNGMISGSSSTAQEALI
jgi:hypothetical protein